jgi:hypothetical protein
MTEDGREYFYCSSVRSECVNETLHRLLKPLLEQAAD